MDNVQLQILLSRLVGAKFLSLTTATSTKMNKTNGERKAVEKRLNPFHGRLVSVRTSTYQPNYDYGGAVNRAQAKTGVGDGASFETGETWYERVRDDQDRMTAFGRHKGNGTLYFVGRELNKGATTYIASHDIMELENAEGSEPTGVVLYHAGDAVPYDAFRQYVPAYKPSAKQGLGDDEIKARTLKLESIWGIKVNGSREIIDPNPNRVDATEVIRGINNLVAQMPDINLDSIPTGIPA